MAKLEQTIREDYNQLLIGMLSLNKNRTFFVSRLFKIKCDGKRVDEGKSTALFSSQGDEKSNQQ